MDKLNAYFVSTVMKRSKKIYICYSFLVVSLVAGSPTESEMQRAVRCYITSFLKQHAEMFGSQSSPTACSLVVIVCSAMFDNKISGFCSRCLLVSHMILNAKSDCLAIHYLLNSLAN